MSANSLKQAVSSFSTPTITLGSAVSGFNAFTAADDGIEQTYWAFEGDDFQICTGVYTHSGPTLVVTHILQKSVSGVVTDLPATGITLTSAAEIIIGGNGLNQAMNYKEGVYSTNYFFSDNIIRHDRPNAAPGNEFGATAGRITTLSVRFNNPTKITSAGFIIGTTSSGDNIRGALYTVNSDGTVGNLVMDTGNISTTVTGITMATLSSPIIIPAGDYYQCSMADNTTVTASGLSTGDHIMGSRQGMIASDTTPNGERRNQYDVTYGAFPATLTTVAATTDLGSPEMIYR